VDAELVSRGTPRPQQLLDSIDEVVDCCDDMSQAAGDQYAAFSKIGKSVAALLRQLS
jgi:hypothetical protein